MPDNLLVWIIVIVALVLIAALLLGRPKRAGAPRAVAGEASGASEQAPTGMPPAAPVGAPTSLRDGHEAQAAEVAAEILPAAGAPEHPALDTDSEVRSEGDSEVGSEEDSEGDSEGDSVEASQEASEEDSEEDSQEDSEEPSEAGLVTVVHEDRIAAWRERVAAGQQDGATAPTESPAEPAWTPSPGPSRPSVADEAAAAALDRIREAADGAALSAQPQSDNAAPAGEGTDASELMQRPSEGQVDRGDLPVVVGAAGSGADRDLVDPAAPGSVPDSPRIPSGERGEQFSWGWDQAGAVAQPLPPEVAPAAVGADDVSLDPSDVDDYVTPGVDPMDAVALGQAQPTSSVAPVEVGAHDEVAVPGVGDSVEVEELDEPVEVSDFHGPVLDHSADVVEQLAPLEGSERVDGHDELSVPGVGDTVEVEELDEPVESAEAGEPDARAQGGIARAVGRDSQPPAGSAADDPDDLATWSALVARHQAEGRAVVGDSSAGEPTPAASVRVSEPHEVMDGGYGWGSAAPIADGAIPVGHPVKANWHYMKFQAPGDPWYDRMTPDVWFVDSQTASSNGFSRS